MLLETLVNEATRWLEYLQVASRDIINGHRKEQLTDWWLTLIDRRVNQYLEEQGYRPEALPEDYIRDCPQDLDVVRANLKLVQEVIDIKGPKRQATKQFIEELKALIYREIDAFAAENKCLLQQTLRLKARDFQAGGPWQTLVKEASSKAPEQVQNWVRDFLEDYQYIEEMKRMEEVEFVEEGGDQKLRLSAVVPISGLIVGKFSILENELSTALSFWEERQQPIDPAPEPDKPSPIKFGVETIDDTSATCHQESLESSSGPLGLSDLSPDNNASPPRIQIFAARKSDPK